MGLLCVSSIHIHIQANRNIDKMTDRQQTGNYSNNGHVVHFEMARSPNLYLSLLYFIEAAFFTPFLFHAWLHKRMEKREMFSFTFFPVFSSNFKTGDVQCSFVLDVALHHWSLFCQSHFSPFLLWILQINNQIKMCVFFHYQSFYSGIHYYYCQ